MPVHLTPPYLLRRNVKHVLTHRVIYADFYLLETDERPTLPPDYIWVHSYMYEMTKHSHLCVGQRHEL